jgi:CRP/FNR family cyclic AMP-dependent transcriptional regulator
MSPGTPSVDALAALARVEIFAGMTADELAEVAAKLRRRHYQRGEVLFSQGSPGSSLYIVESGRVRISLTSADGKELVLNVLEPGDIFGEMALLDGEPRSAGAAALEPCQVLLLARPAFLQFLELHPAVTLRLLAILSRRVRHDTRLLQDAVFLDIPGRLASTLLHLSRPQGPAATGPLVVETRLTQAELAGMIGATRESVSKWLSFYQRQGVLRRRKGQIVILRPEVMRARLS